MLFSLVSRRLGCVILFVAFWCFGLPRAAAQALPVLPGRQVLLLPYTTLGRNFSQAQIVSGTLNGNLKSSFLLDTGSNRALIASDTVAMLHLRTMPRLGSLLMIDGRQETIAPALLMFHGFQFDLQSDVVDRSHLQALGPSIDGVVGMDNLRALALLYDFRRHVVTLVNGGNLSSTELRTLGFGGVTAIVLKRSNGLYSVQARLGSGFRQRTESLVVDTGSNVTFLPNASAKALALQAAGPDTQHQGFDPRSYSVTHSRTTLSLGDLTLRDQPVAFPSDDRSEVDPVLGLDVLSQFRVLLDFPAGKMYLAPLSPAAPVPVKPSDVPSVAVPAAKP